MSPCFGQFPIRQTGNPDNKNSNQRRIRVSLGIIVQTNVFNPDKQRRPCWSKKTNKTLRVGTIILLNHDMLVGFWIICSNFKTKRHLLWYIVSSRIWRSVLTVSESKSAPGNPVMSQQSKELEIACPAVVVSLPVESITEDSSAFPCRLLSGSPLRWFTLLNLRVLSSASFFLFCAIYLSAWADV